MGDGIPRENGGPTATSRSLLARARTGDQAAWDRLVHLYAPLVMSWCRRSLQPADAADVFQEVFRTVAARLESFRKEQSGDTFRGWLRVVTRNKLNDHFRARTREPRGVGGSSAAWRLAQIPGAGENPRDDQDEESRQLARLVARALAIIRPEFRESSWLAFKRTAMDGCSAPDVARELGMSPGAVRVAKSRVLGRLRLELGDLEQP